jgi:hypothetical protein
MEMKNISKNEKKIELNLHRIIFGRLCKLYDCFIGFDKWIENLLINWLVFVLIF